MTNRQRASIPAEQTTIAGPIEFSGIGLHTGRKCKIILNPLGANQGILFKSVAANGSYLTIPATIQSVSDLRLATSIKSGDAEVRSVEHLLSAIHGSGVDNIEIVVEGSEIPILDGSAAPIVASIRAVGLVSLDSPRSFLRLIKPLSLQSDNCSATLRPHQGFQITYTICFEHPLIGVQTFTCDWTSETYERQIAPARTFGFLTQLELLKNQGLAKGGSLDNAVLFSPSTIINPPLRFDDEPVRHKILDAFGDLLLLGNRLLATIHIERGGHAFHMAIIKEILADPEYYRIETLY